MCSPLAGQLIKFLQDSSNTPVWCSAPQPRIAHLPGKGLRSGLPSPSTSLFLIRRAGCWLVLRGSEQSSRVCVGGEGGCRPALIPTRRCRRSPTGRTVSSTVGAGGAGGCVISPGSGRVAGSRHSSGLGGTVRFTPCLSFPRRAGSDASFGLRGLGGGYLANGACSYSGGGRGECGSVWAMSRQLPSRDPTCRYWSILTPSHALPVLLPAPLSQPGANILPGKVQGWRSRNSPRPQQRKSGGGCQQRGAPGGKRCRCCCWRI